MKRTILALALLLGGTAVAHADPGGPPGLTPGPAPQGPMAPYADGGPGAYGPGAYGPQRGAQPGRMQRGPRGGARMGRHRLPPRVRARLVQMFDRDGDGRLQGPERREARRFVRQLIKRRMHAAQGARGQGGGRGFGPRGGR